MAEKQRKTFLSYSRVNKEFAIRLAKELKSEGFDIWLDQLDIPAGARWDREVEKALRESEIFMIILTPASVESENVLDEIGYAIDNTKRFLPVLLENCNVPLRLRRFQYVDFTNKNFDDGVESAKELLRGLISQPTIPRAEFTGTQVQAEAERQARTDADPLAKQKADEEQSVSVTESSEIDRRIKEEAERLLAKKTEEERLAKAQADAERKAKAEARRKAKEEADRLAAQKTEEERLTQAKEEEELAAKAKIEKERNAKAEADRLAKQEVKEEARRLTAQKAEESEVTVKAKSASVSAETVKTKPTSKVVMYSIVGVVVLAIIGIGLNARSNGGNKNLPDVTPTTKAITPTKVSTQAPAKSPTRPPTQVPTMVPTSASPVDTFDDNSNGWNTGSTKVGVLSVADGHYIWDVKGLGSGSDAWQFFKKDASYSDFEVSVDAKRVGGTPGNLCYGITFRSNIKSFNGIVGEGSGQYYELEVCDDQTYVIDYYNGSDWIYDANFESSTAIKTNDWNTLKVKANGTQFEYFINGVSVGKFTDTNLAQGNIGLTAYSYNGLSGQGEVWFDNFSLIEK